MKQIFRKIGIGLGIVVLVLILAVIGLIAYLSVTEYKPESRESAEVSGWTNEAFSGDSLSVLS